MSDPVGPTGATGPVRSGDPGPGAGALARRLRYLGGFERADPGEGGAPAGPAGARSRRGGRPPVARALSGWDRVGELTWRRLVRRENPLEGEPLSEFLLPPGYRAEDLLFFDTETTGLSGGAGNYVFLFGSARLEGRELVSEQLFLGDFPGEPEFLEALAERLRQHRLFLSYNGRAFDAPLLKSRFVLNRMEFELERQEDLLFWARRLWRRWLPNCSLGSVEREILGIERPEDVPGWEVPGIYLSYLATGEETRLPLVMEHNLQDVLSLVRLYGHLNGLLGCERLPAGADGAALGSYLLRLGQRRGASVLRESFSAGDQRAGRALSLHYKRLGEWERAASLWEGMVGERSLFAAVELAKYHEHRRRDPRTALRWVGAAEAWGLPLSREERTALAHRRRRLERKCTGRDEAPGPAKGGARGDGAGGTPQRW
ncbi:MAG: ribonuclease H-like domain-containing protein [Spirochaetales bacterium]|nr:ribonuclease H-like domain-containing protein [Spirochaetales bacterium]